MDRSIDSIGSCSLDADSTDFSDTSESLNFISPSSTREEFTAGIAERTRYGKVQQPVALTPKLILNQPSNQRSTTTMTYFDINSGKINTIVSRAGGTNGRFFNGLSTESFLSTKTIELQSPTVVAHANKKPSYLNLACCVNGYSNYTNYDSEERKEINKSREVSPIRPIISMSRQQRSNENLLSVPAPVTFVKQSPLTSISKRFASLNLNDKDTTDNASLPNGNGNVTNRKSFIQQRVEKLYGTTTILTTVKTSESVQLNGNGTIHHLNGSTTINGNSSIAEEKENDEDCVNSLPVMKHLRPEFCKQLQFMSSPKKSITRIVKQTSNGQTFKFENVSSGNTNGIEKQNPSKTNEIHLSNSELVSKDCPPIVDQVVSSPEKIVESEKEVVSNGVKSNISENQSSSEMNGFTSQKSELKDGHYFLKLLNTEKSRILALADEHEVELNQLQSSPATALSEEMNGIILAAIGKSRLLATKKFKQFEGLCDENLKPKADGPQTLSGDLQGFWDMMMLQVDNIDDAFSEIKKYRANAWTKIETPVAQPPKGSRLIKRPLTQSQSAKAKNVVPNKKPSTAPSDAAQKRDEQRKKLLEMKRKQKAAMLNGGDENGITDETGDVNVNGNGKENEEIIL